MKYRIQEKKYDKGSCYQIQYKFLFWWYDEEGFPYAEEDYFFVDFKQAKKQLDKLNNPELPQIKYHY